MPRVRIHRWTPGERLIICKADHPKFHFLPVFVSADLWTGDLADLMDTAVYGFRVKRIRDAVIFNTTK